MLEKHGTSFSYTVFLIAAVLAGLSAQLSVEVFSVMPRLRSDLGQIQKVDFIGSIARLAVLGALAFVFLNAGVAVVAGSGALLLQYLLSRQYAAGIIDLQAEENAEDRKAMLGFIRARRPTLLFFLPAGADHNFLDHLFWSSRWGGRGGCAWQTSDNFSPSWEIWLPIYVRLRSRAAERITNLFGSTPGLSVELRV